MPWITGLWLAVGAFVLAMSEAAQCPVTLVEQYKYDCGLKGDLQIPDKLKRFKAPNLTSCAAKCLGLAGCKSFRFRSGVSECVLYAKYLDQMLFNDHGFERGIFYNRECYSSNCDVIEACKAGEKCKIVNGDDEYTQYACSYGHIANSRKQYADIAISGSLDACKAIQECKQNYPEGSFDVHYDIKNSNWRCILFDNEMGSSYYPSMQGQRISRRTYSTVNSSVGMGYGYFWSEYY